jgi:hypothetical protein
MKRWIIAIGFGSLTTIIAATMLRPGPLPPIAVDLPHPESHQRHSIADFERLRQGISYDEASRTLGHVGYFGVLGPAESVPTHLSPGSKVFTWPNPSGSRIVLVFKKDQLIEKKQFGLK